MLPVAPVAPVALVGAASASGASGARGAGSTRDEASGGVGCAVFFELIGVLAFIGFEGRLETAEAY